MGQSDLNFFRALAQERTPSFLSHGFSLCPAVEWASCCRQLFRSLPCFCSRATNSFSRFVSCCAFLRLLLMSRDVEPHLGSMYSCKVCGGDVTCRHLSFRCSAYSSIFSFRASITAVAFGFGHPCTAHRSVATPFTQSISGPDSPPSPPTAPSR